MGKIRFPGGNVFFPFTRHYSELGENRLPSGGNGNIHVVLIQLSPLEKDRFSG
jgi:hypothetical protein